MGVRNTIFGGADWEAGTALASEDLNDTFNATSVIHRKLFTQATEDTDNTDGWADSTSSFTITNGLNALILGIYIKCDLKVNGGTGSMNLKINGTNLGTIYITDAEFRLAAAFQDTVGARINPSEAPLFRTNSVAYKSHSMSIFIPLKLLDATTTFTVRIFNGGGGAIVGIDEIDIRVVYADVFTDD